MFFLHKKEPVSYIIVFLGNPGLKFENTRHNAGFMTADIIARELGVKTDRVRFKSLTATVSFGGEQVLLMKPQTYMNLSGDAVRQAVKFYKLQQQNVIVVVDDIALPPGAIRVRRSGSAGGHNGLKDIIAKTGGDGFPRIRIGVGAPPNDEYELYDWVLSKMSEEEIKTISEGALRAAAAAELLIMEGIDAAMRKFNYYFGN